MEENLKKLLTLVKEVCDDHRQYKKGFNVITTFVKPHREVELHSRFITWLLDSKGPHKLKHLPLELFLKKIGSHFTVSSTTKVIPNASNWTEDRDMDILIYDKEQNFAIIIENKIYAKDSDKGENNGQLARYFYQIKNGVKVQNGAEVEDNNISYFKCDQDDRIELYYLTLDKHEPNKLDFETKDNQDSKKKVKLHIGEGDKGITLISYLDNIEPWITDVLNSDACKKNPQTIEIIQQYLDVLHCVSPNVKLNQDLFAKIEESLSYMQTLRTFLVNHQNLVNLQPEKIEEALSNEVDEPLRASAIFILKNHKHLYWHALAAFFDDLSRDLEELLKPLGVTKVEHPENLAEPISNIIHQRGEKKKEHPYWGFWYNEIWWTMQLNEEYHHFFFGVDSSTEPNKDNKSLQQLKTKFSENRYYTDIPGWHALKYLHECTIEFEGENVTLPILNPWDFTKGDTFDLLNEDKRKIIAQQYAKFVKDELAKLN